jgi:hypothetical protein
MAQRIQKTAIFCRRLAMECDIVALDPEADASGSPDGRNAIP